MTSVTSRTAAAMWRGGLINESQLGAIANGGTARFSFAHDDVLVSSSAGFSQSARSDTSTRFEAGKQAGPDTIKHFLSGGQEGQAAMANWLRAGFEMDRHGNWRLKPQAADTLRRDVQAIMAQTGWTRSIERLAQDQNSMGTDVGLSISAAANRSGPSKAMAGDRKSSKGGISGGAAGSLEFESSEIGITSETANAGIDIVNYDVRQAIVAAERAASRSATPAHTFSQELSRQVLRQDGLRSRYLDQADAGRGTANITGPLTSIEQSSVLRTGRFSNDLENGPFDGHANSSNRNKK